MSPPHCAGGGPNNDYLIFATYLPSESSYLTLKSLTLPTRGMAQDTGLGLPRLGGASAGPWAAARRMGPGAAATTNHKSSLLLFLPGA